jgi:hypothetical protein
MSYLYVAVQVFCHIQSICNVCKPICAACRASKLLCLPRVQLGLLTWSASWRSRHWQTHSCSWPGHACGNSSQLAVPSSQRHACN